MSILRSLDYLIKIFKIKGLDIMIKKCFYNKSVDSIFKRVFGE